MDAGLLEWVAAHRAWWLDAAMLALSAAGTSGLVWLALAGVRALASPRSRMAVWQVAAAILLTWLLADGVLKPAVGRPRPFQVDAALSVVGGRPESASFPSGHAAVAIAAALTLSAAWPGGRVAWWLLAALVSVSRVYLGVHYPTDIIAGGLLGWFVGWFVVGRTRWRAPLTSA